MRDSERGAPRATAAPGQPFVLGVNYWPRRKAMYWWADFDAGEVREEFGLIRELGLAHVRIFLLWESFQPLPGQVSARALGDLRTVCDVAAELGLALQVTFFTGHMSGPNWAPPWLIDRGRPRRAGDRQLVGLEERTGSAHPLHDVWTTPFVIDAQDRLLRAVCSELRDHPAVWAWSLGNEPDLFCRPRDATTGRAWVRDRAATIRSLDPVRQVMVGTHTASLEGDVGFRVHEIAAETDIPVMHAYPFYSTIVRRPLDPDFVPFAAALTATLAGRPVLLEEFGVNTSWPDAPSGWRSIDGPGLTGREAYFASEEDAAAYVGAVLPRLVAAGCLGAYVWCFADYASELWDRPPCDRQPHERFFGLVRPDGTLKPGALVLRDFARSGPRVTVPVQAVTLPGSPDDYYRDPGLTMRHLYERFAGTA